jgi:uncharacterized protein YecT (DUF1311 family)
MSEDEQGNYVKISEEYKKADRKLNEIYANQVNEYQKEGAAFYGQEKSKDIYLKNAQQAWVKMRDASCDYETYESHKGTGFSSIYEQCLLDKTNERVKYLKENNRGLLLALAYSGDIITMQEDL